MQRQNIVQRPNDPYIYLFVMGEWYCYNPADEPLGSGAMGTVYLGSVSYTHLTLPTNSRV